MKGNIHKNLLKLLKSKVVLAVSGGMLLASCGAYTGGYSETDGVYYNPNTDVLPQADIAYGGGNHVGDYYDYNDTETGIIERNAQNQKDWNNRYSNDNWRNGDGSNSDWGTFSGSETNYRDWGWGGGMYGWGSPWGWNRFGMGLGWGGYYGMSMNFGMGWGSPWGWGASWGWGSPWSWYNPYFGFYSGRWGGMYNPYWGWGGHYGGGLWGAGYYPYYGYRGNSFYTAPRRQSGADGYYNNTRNTGRMSNQQNTGGFRTNNNTYQRGMNNTGAVNSQPRMRATQRTTNTGNPTYRQVQPRMQNRSYESRSYETNRSYETRSNSGYRSSGGNSGGFRSGGFGGGSTGGGGMRSGGGGMRTGGR